METVAAPGARQGSQIKHLHFFPSAEPESDCIPFNAKTEKFVRTVDNKGSFQTFICKATGAKGNKNLGVWFFSIAVHLKSIS